MSETAGKLTLTLRHTRETDLDAVLAIERHPDNAPFVGQWPREQHDLTLKREGAEHLVVTTADNAVAGYLIAYDLAADGFGVWIQRIAVTDKSHGVGRAVLSAYLGDAMDRLSTELTTLDVMRTNHRAQRMYRSIGFDEVTLADDERARLEHLVGGMDDDTIIMQLAADELQPQERYEVRLA